MRVRLSVAVAACLLAFSPLLRHARAQEVQSREAIGLQNQIYQLQQEVQSLRQRSSDDGDRSSLGRREEESAPRGASNALLPQLLSRVGTLEDQVRDLRGRLDELQNQSQQQIADLNKQLSDLKFQLGNGGAGGGGAGDTGGGPPDPVAPGGRMTSPQPGNLGAYHPPSQRDDRPDHPLPLTAQRPRPPVAPVNATPEIAMHNGYAALAQHNFQGAEAAARGVLSTHRTSPRAYDAQYLLAQSLTGEHQYSQAAIAYDDAYNRNRKGVHAAPALVGLASSLASINEKRAACETLVKLHAEFPQSATQLRPQIASVRQRAGCQ